MTQAEKLIEVAYSQVGTAENPLGSNDIVYNTDYYGHPVHGDYPWCMAFVWDMFQYAKLGKYFYNGCKTASCTTLMKWAANAGLMVYKGYRMGDVFLYDYDKNPKDSEHTGIFTGEMENGKYVVIEGNYADKVSIVKRSASEIIGAFRPPFDDAPAPDPVKIELPELAKGDKGACVESLQILLEGNGFSCGRYGIDGDFGGDTEKAVKGYQSYHGLGADGIVGIKTWGRLLGV